MALSWNALKYDRISLIKSVIFIIFLYVYLYSPNLTFINIGTIKILLILSFLYFFIKPISIKYFFLFKEDFVLFFSLLIISILFSLRMKTNIFDVPYKQIIWFLECYFIPIFLIRFFKSEIRTNTLVFYLICVGFVAALISFFLILFPESNYILRTKYIESLDIDEFRFRGFGVAESISFSYGVLQGLILGLCFYYSSQNRFYLIPIVFLFIAILFNARIGFILASISLLFALLNQYH